MMACNIELRNAIEPWYTLGEEPGAGGTARYVDSSLERIQVTRSDGLFPSAMPSSATAAASPAAYCDARGICLRRAFPRLATAPLPAPDDSREHSAGD